MSAGCERWPSTSVHIWPDIVNLLVLPYSNVCWDFVIWNYSFISRRVVKGCGQPSTKDGLSCQTVDVLCRMLS